MSNTNLSPFHWRETPRQTKDSRPPAPPKLFNGLKKAERHPFEITLTGSEQGRKDHEKIQRTRGTTR